MFRMKPPKPIGSVSKPDMLINVSREEIPSAVPAEKGESVEISEADTHDQVYEALMEEYNMPPTEVIPSINGGLPITMTVKKGRAESLGGSMAHGFLNQTGTQVQQIKYAAFQQTMSSLKRNDLSQKRRPFSPPMKFKDNRSDVVKNM